MLNRQTVTVEITQNNALSALQTLEQKHFIRVVEDKVIDSPSMAKGEQLSTRAFKNWISEAESMRTVDLKAAKSKWAGKRKQLQKLTR